MNLYSYFLNNTSDPIHKNVHYFPIYERHFAPFVGRPMTMLEIGSAGGASHMWKRYFGPAARIIVIDEKGDGKRFEDEQVKVRIGHQADTALLSDVLDEFGSPDVILDDGSHQMEDVSATFNWLYRRTAQNGVYLIEDLHTAYWPEYGGGYRTTGSFLERCKELIDELNAEHTRGAIPPTAMTQSTMSIHFYNSVVAFERGRSIDTRSIVVGR